MKATVQMYGLIVTFILVALIIPQLIGFSICYQQTNQFNSMTVDIIEAHEGVTAEAEAKINSLRNRYPIMSISYTKTEVSNGYFTYTVSSSRPLHIGILELRYTVTSTKVTKRLIY